MTPTNQTPASEAEKKVFARTYWLNVYPNAAVSQTLAASRDEALNRCAYDNDGPMAAQVEVKIIPVAEAARADALEAALRKLLRWADGMATVHTHPFLEDQDNRVLEEARRLLGSEAHNGKKGGA